MQITPTRSFTQLVSSLGAFSLALAWSGAALSGQQATSPTAPSLTAADYVEIRQLVARYAYAVDSGADNGNVYASLFAPDGAFADRMGRETTGRDALAALARRNTRGAQSAFHFIVNHVIEPSPTGAIGREYLLQLRIGEGERPNDVFGGGHYDDSYVRTPDGWRFKRRQFIPSEGGPRPRAAAQQPASASVAALTALDYLEIEQLVYRYGYALDSGADNGYAYADLYAPDATFTGTNQGPSGRTYQGRDRLAALARGGKRGPSFVSHYVTNVVIEPTSEGAVGRTYVGILDIGNGGNGAKSRVDHGGLYNDVYVKTPQGWRFKSRTFYESRSGEPVQPPPAVIGVPRALPREPVSAPASSSASSSGGPKLTAEDYIQIQQLVARYPYALDQNPDNGASYANLFTPDAVFRQPRTEGRANLAKMATGAPHGPKYTRHFLANHVIEATPEGAVGKQYLVAVDIGEAGQPSSIFLGGHYEDIYAKTTDGWRFKTRTFIASATGTEAR